MIVTSLLGIVVQSFVNPRDHLYDAPDQDRSRMKQDAIVWRDNGTPVSRHYDDPYFALDDGLCESRYVFLRGNNLPNRFGAGHHIAELGFGTGLNFLAAWECWRDAGAHGTLRYTGFEQSPLSRADMERALARWPELAPLASQLLALWDPDRPKYAFGAVHLELIRADARLAVPAWRECADTWFLDGFSPARNPEMWEDPLLGSVHDHTREGGGFATYTAAGHVRRALANAGFLVERLPGYGRKRHMTRGEKPTASQHLPEPLT